VTAILFSTAAPPHSVVHAQEALGLCQSTTHADAYSYEDPNVYGSSDATFSVRQYSRDDCLTLAEAEANFQAGLACENVGIPGGQGAGLGYARASWFVVWIWGDLDNATYVGPLEYHEQQYDCADTFS